MNHIQITNDLAIRSDDKQWKLCRLTVVTDKDTKEKIDTWNSFKYYGSFKSCVKDTGRYLVRCGNAQSSDELLELAKSVSKLLKLALDDKFSVDVKCSV